MHLTGGGMTVALSHIVLLRDLLRPQLNDTSSFANIPSPSTPWQVAPTMNTLAGALYKVFRASPDHPARNEMCQACFDCMSLEGVFSNGLIALLSGLDPRPLSSVLDFFAVAIYGVGRLPLSLVCTVLSRLCRLGCRGCPVSKLLTIENHQQYFKL